MFSLTSKHRQFSKSRAMTATVIVFASLISLAASQHAGTVTPEEHPSITIYTCDDLGCVSEDAFVTLQDNRRPVYSVDGTETLCLSNGVWDPVLCPDSVTCAQNCGVDGLSVEDYRNIQGVTTSGSSVTLKYVTETAFGTNIGSNIYLVTADEEYRMFRLKNREFAVDIDTSAMECGMNGALFFIEMEMDGGMSAFPTNNAGAKYGTGHCDGQCAHWKHFIGGQANIDGDFPYGECCVEMDVWEANK